MRVRTLLIATTLLAATGTAPSAQSFSPTGLWKGETSGDYLLLWGDGFCSAGGAVAAAGTCRWDASATGGTLSMTPDRTSGPTSLSYDIEWVDPNTILVNDAERFLRLG